MEYKGLKVSGLKIAYVGGGSRGWAWGLMSDLAAEPDLSGTVSLYDIDFSAASDNEIIGNSIKNQDDIKGIWNYKAAGTIKEALEGADFVVISILPGTFKDMEKDVHAPEKYGIYQSVGDSTGPGGLSRAMRTVPMYEVIASSIKQYAPDAWVINYTNPMSVCTRTLYEVYPGIKAFGCCHEVFGTQYLLMDMLKDMCDIEVVKRSEIKINVLGINHFTWIDRANYKGMDLMPIFGQFAEKYYEKGFKSAKEENKESSFFSFTHRVKFDLYRRYGLIAAAGDRHLAEFMPPRYLKNPETVKKWGFDITPVSWRISELEKRKEKCKRLVSGEELFTIKSTGEEGVNMIKALLGLGDIITNVNIPNHGQVKGMPEGAVVETNALFSSNSVQPVLAGELPADLHCLVLRHILNQETIINAALTFNKDLAYRAFVNDPLVSIDLADAKMLFNELMENK
jgi:galacturan 1,4-alpha-galacturonidase